MTCIHHLRAGADGLCPACRADYDEDPAAWLEYGDHADGLNRWYGLLDEMARRPPEREGGDAALPF